MRSTIFLAVFFFNTILELIKSDDLGRIFTQTEASLSWCQVFLVDREMPVVLG